MASDKITTLLQDILNWMDAHDDVLPMLPKQLPAGREEEARLKKNYNNYLERPFRAND